MDSDSHSDSEPEDLDSDSDLVDSIIHRCHVPYDGTSLHEHFCCVFAKHLCAVYSRISTTSDLNYVVHDFQVYDFDTYITRINDGSHIWLQQQRRVCITGWAVA